VALSPPSAPPAPLTALLANIDVNSFDPTATASAAQALLISAYSLSSGSVSVQFTSYPVSATLSITLPAAAPAGAAATAAAALLAGVQGSLSGVSAAAVTSAAWAASSRRLLAGGTTSQLLVSLQFTTGPLAQTARTAAAQLSAASTLAAADASLAAAGFASSGCSLVGQPSYGAILSISIAGGISPAVLTLIRTELPTRLGGLAASAPPPPSPSGTPAPVAAASGTPVVPIVVAIVGGAGVLAIAAFVSHRYRALRREPEKKSSSQRSALLINEDETRGDVLMSEENRRSDNAPQ